MPQEELLQNDDIFLNSNANLTKIKARHCCDLNLGGRVIASDHFIVIRLQPSFRYLASQQFLQILLESAPYQAALRSMAGGRTRKLLVPSELARIKIPDLPVEKRHLIRQLCGKNIPKNNVPWRDFSLIDLMTKVVTTDFASAPAVRHFTTNKDWTDFINLADQAPIERLREILARLGAHALRIAEQSRCESESFAGWARQLGGQTKSLEEVLGHPSSAEKIVALQRWRREVERSDVQFHMAEQKYADTVKSDPQSLRKHLNHHFLQIRHGLATFAKRCEDEIARDFEPFRELNREKQRQENEFREELRIKKHRLAQIVAQIRCGVDTVSKTLTKEGSISKGAPIGVSGKNSLEYLASIAESCKEMGEFLEKLTERPEFEHKAPLNLKRGLQDVASEHNSDNVRVVFEHYFPSLDDEDNGKIEPMIQIGRKDFHDLCRNIIENAKRHGFRDQPANAEVRIELSFLRSERMLQVVFKNNGKPMPKGMDTEHFVRLGVNAGPTGNTGIGGYHVKQIMDHVRGTVEVASRANDAFPVQITLRFPLTYERE